MREVEIDIFEETLSVIKAGYYKKDGKKIYLKLKDNELNNAILISDKDNSCIEMKNRLKQKNSMVKERCIYRVRNINSFDAAINLANTMADENKAEKVLVLNFANPNQAGGGVRSGARAQEEDLCRRSTLIASLESEQAYKMYKYNSENWSLTSSDYMVLSPNVEIIRDANCQFIEESKIVSVLSSPAPIASDGTYGLPIDEYNKIAYNRIMRILLVAFSYGYKRLVLGAWGCGAFGNDAKVFAKFFYDALYEINSDNIFDIVEFAIWSPHNKDYNLECFYNQFSELL